MFNNYKKQDKLRRGAMVEDEYGFYVYKYDKQDNLRSKEVKQLIEGKYITEDQALELTEKQLDALEEKEILARVIARTLDIRLADTPKVQDYVDQELMTLEEVLRLGSDPRGFLNYFYDQIMELIIGKNITMNEVLELYDLHDDLKRELVFGKYITFEKVKNLNLTELHKEFLVRAGYLINEGYITRKEALELTPLQIGNIYRTYDFIIDEKITVEQVKNLKNPILPQINVVDNRVSRLINGKYITFAQLFALTEEQYNKLLVASGHIQGGRITVEEATNLDKKGLQKELGNLDVELLMPRFRFGI